MQVQKLVPLRNTDKRRNNKYIILVQISNFSLRHNPMTPDLQGFLPYFTGSKHDQYFYENLEKRILPFHFLANYFSYDWQILTSTPLNARSAMIDNAISCGYIETFMRDAIVIAVQDDFTVRIPESRMYEVLGSKTIAPLLQSMKLGNFRDTVFWFDEVFNMEKYHADMEKDPLNNPYKYKVRPMKHFDRVQFNLETRRFI